MTNPQTPSDLRLLLAEHDWFVRLAKRLARTEADADDLVQETYALALRRGGPRSIEPRPWLWTTVRSLWRERRRGESRRRAREARSAKPEAVPSTAEAVERAALRRDLAELVLELDPHERDVVVLRYFEGVPYGLIGERLGISADSARQRASRGVKRLRTLLDERAAEAGHEDARATWMRAIAPLVTLRGDSVLGVPAAGGLLLAKPMLMSASALALLFIGFKLCSGLLTGPLSERPASMSTARTQDSPPSQVGASATAPETARRLPAQAQPAQAVATDAVLVLDSGTGVPVPGVPWTLDPAELSLPPGALAAVPATPHASGVTDSLGLAHIPRFESPAAVFRTLRTNEHAASALGVTLARLQQASSPLARLTRGTTVVGRVVDEHNSPREGAVLYSFEGASGEPVELARTSADGSFQATNLSDYASGFSFDEAGALLPTRLSPPALAPIPKPWGSSAPGAAWRRGAHLVRCGELNRIDLGDLVVPRSRHYRGSIMRADGTPVSGALVSLDPQRIAAWRNSQATESEALGAPWSTLRIGETTTLVDGSFDIDAPAILGELGIIGAQSPMREWTAQSLEPVATGGLSALLRLELRERPALRLALLSSHSGAPATELLPGAPRDQDGQWMRTPPAGAWIQLHGSPSGRHHSLQPGSIVELPAAGNLGTTIAGFIELSGYRPKPFQAVLNGDTLSVRLDPAPRISIGYRLTRTPEGEVPSAEWLAGCRAKVTAAAGELWNPADFVPGREGLPSPAYPRLAAVRHSIAPGEVCEYPVAFGSEVHVLLTVETCDGVAIRCGPLGPLRVRSGAYTLDVDLSRWIDQRGESGRVVAQVLSQESGEVLETAYATADLELAHHDQRSDQHHDEQVELMLQPGAHRICILADGYRTQELGLVQVEPGATVDLGTIRLAPSESLPLQLIDSNGVALGQHIQVAWQAPAGYYRTTRTDPAGRVDLDAGSALPEGLFVSRPNTSKMDSVPAWVPLMAPLQAHVGDTAIPVQVNGWHQVLFEVTGIPAELQSLGFPLLVHHEDGRIATPTPQGFSSGSWHFEAWLPEDRFTVQVIGGESLGLSVKTVVVRADGQVVRMEP